MGCIEQKLGLGVTELKKWYFQVRNIGPVPSLNIRTTHSRSFQQNKWLLTPVGRTAITVQTAPYRYIQSPTFFYKNR